MQDRIGNRYSQDCVICKSGEAVKQPEIGGLDIVVLEYGTDHVTDNRPNQDDLLQSRPTPSTHTTKLNRSYGTPGSVIASRPEGGEAISSA